MHDRTDQTESELVSPERRPDRTVEEAPSWRARWNRFVEPRADGLPNARVVGVPLGLLAAVFVTLVALGLTGSSTGIIHSMISTGEDSSLVAGEPRGIRSDEWFVQTSWVISQVEQSLPIVNETFPGGMDATVQNDLPSGDWSTAFRPHLTGFFFLPLDQAMAFKWWLPGVGLIAATYLFAITMLPRRPLVGAALAVGFFFAPFFQWWYLSLSLYPAMWALLVMTAIVWAVRARSRRGVWILSALVAYITPALGMGIYVPFIVPVVIVVAAFGVGAVCSPDLGRPRFAQRLRDVTPVLIAGAVGGAVMVVWMATRWDTISAFTETVYPGERLQAVGGASANELAQLLSGFIAFGLERTQGAPLSVNSSEASTFFLPGLCLIVPLIWLIVRRRRAGAPWDGLSIGAVAAGLVMLAFLFIPGWDALAHALFLDRTTNSRMRIGFGVLSLVLVVLVAARYADARRRGIGRPPWWVPGSSAALAAASVAYVVWQALNLVGVEQLGAVVARRDLALGAIFALTFVVIAWLFAANRLLPAAAGLLVLSVAQSGLVNPVYVGVLDLRETETVQQIQELDEQDPGVWVGINSSLLPTMMLVQSGVESYNGVQGSPAEEMWDAIDPAGRDEEVWNRLATTSWLPGEGEPEPRNPAPDQIQMTFDSCSDFAAQHVSWVLSEVALDQRCVQLVEEIPQGPQTMRIYEVTPSP